MEIFERSMGLKMTRPCDRDVERKSPEKRDLEMVERRGEVMGIVSSAVSELLDLASGLSSCFL